MPSLRLAVSLLFLPSFALPGQALSTETPAVPPASPRAPDADGIADLLAKLGEDVQTFNDHVVTLANPFMEGRVPGSRGMEIAMQYMEYWFAQAAVEPAFPKAGGTTPWRQPFPLGGTIAVEHQHLQLGGAALDLEVGRDYIGSRLGKGEATAEVVFAGYGVGRGPEDFTSVPDEVSLEGKIAFVFRFEPMNDAGKSLWAEDNDPWSRHANLDQKLRLLQRRKVAGVLIANPPNCADPRASKLEDSAAMTQRRFPVLMLSTAGAEKLVSKLGADGKSLADLRALADKGGACFTFANKLTAAVALTEKKQIAENVGAILPGKGPLAGEYIVIGGHLDHLGMGEFGSRSGPGKLHPGADDNATGSAALLMLADKLKRAYAADERPARTIVFIAFSAEESGLNGSAYYVRNPLVPLEQHALMINFDMIGRIRNKRLSVQGLYTARGLKEFLDPILAQSPLELVMPKGVLAASDHAPFQAKKVPVLFSIIADFHGDYHTPADTSSKINREDAVHVVRLYEQIALAVATRTERFEFTR